MKRLIVLLAAIGGILRVVAATEITLDDNAVVMLASADSSSRIYRLNAGMLVVAHSNALENAQVAIASGAVLRFSTSCTLYATNSISGAGTVEIGNGATLEVYSRFQDFTGNWVLDGGKVVSRKVELDRGDLLGVFQFDDAENPWADSSPQNNALQVGFDVNVGTSNPLLVDDAQRGKVLYLDGESWLTGSGENGTQPGFDIGSSPFTIAYWVKTTGAEESENKTTYNQGMMFMYGTRGSAKRVNVWYGGYIGTLRYNVYSGLDFNTDTKIYGGRWVHYAITHNGEGTIRVYVNGELKNTQSGALPNLAGGRLCIGYGIDATGVGEHKYPFKGYMDDIVFAKSVLSATDLMNLSNTLSADGDPDGNFTDVANLGGGELDVGTNLTVSAASQLAAKGAAEALRENIVESWEFETGTGETSTTNTFTLNPFSNNSSSNPVAFPYDAGRGGRVASLDGSKQAYLATANGNTAQPYPDDYPLGSSAFTLSMWVKTEASDNTGLLWFGNPNSGSYNGLSMRLNGGNRNLLMAYGSNFSIDIGGNGFSDWRHMAVTYADGVINLYVDGVLKKTVNQVMDVQVSSGHNKFYLGRYHYNPVFGDVSFDNVRVYRKALSADEIALDKTSKSVRPLAPFRTLAGEPLVNVESGKVWTLDGAAELVAGLAGAGTVILTNDAHLTVASDAGFEGNVQGGGGLALASGYVFKAGSSKADSPMLCNTFLTLPEAAEVSFSCPIRNVAVSEFVLASGNPIVPPSDFSNWTWRDGNGAYSGMEGVTRDVKFVVSGNRLIMQIVTHGFVLSYR